MDSKDINKYIEDLAVKAKSAASLISSIETKKKDSALNTMAEIISERKEQILQANYQDIKEAKDHNISSHLLERLELNESRIDSMVLSLKNIAKLPDPIGNITKLKSTPSGIRVRKMRVPIGVIGIIYESRLNVTADAAALCFKSGNSCILRGGSESLRSNIEISQCLIDALEENKLPKSSVNLIKTSDREAVKMLLSQEESLDLIIPRGGKKLIKSVLENTKIPVLRHLDGICHVFIDKDAEVQKALDISINAKTYRYSICGAMETLLIHKNIAKEVLPKLGKLFFEKEVELRGCKQTIKLIDASEATEQDWVSEYLAPILCIRIVESLDAAIKHINKYGSAHTDSIVTENNERAQIFLKSVDSSSVMHNLPTCWADGFEYGLGAEIGISTDKLHARGPIGLEGLTSEKYLVLGNAELRGI